MSSTNYIEKILDYELEDDAVMKSVESPIASNFQDLRTPQRLLLMTLLCKLPNGPHDAVRERYLQRLSVLANRCDQDQERANGLMREVIQFIIRCTVQGSRCS